MSEKQIIRMHAFIKGRVQGVGFRYFVFQVAQDRDITGWVRNRRDGSVEVTAEGHQDDLNGFLADLRKGPISADVQDVDYTFTEVDGKSRKFQVRATV